MVVQTFAIGEVAILTESPPRTSALNVRFSGQRKTDEYYSANN